MAHDPGAETFLLRCFSAGPGWPAVPPGLAWGGTAPPASRPI